MLSHEGAWQAVGAPAFPLPSAVPVMGPPLNDAVAGAAPWTPTVIDDGDGAAAAVVAANTTHAAVAATAMSRIIEYLLPGAPALPRIIAQVRGGPRVS